MQKLTDIYNFNASTDQDERARLYLTPVAVKLTRGNVSGAEILLKDKPVQVLLGKSEACVLKNEPGAEKAAVLLDFGRELHGNIRLTVSTIKSASERAKMTIRFGESVMEALAPIGHKNATNDHAVRDHIYDLGQWGTVETNESGFRFVYIELEEEDAIVNIPAIHMCFLYRDIPYLGSFECSDPLLEKIWQTAAYTVHLNMQNYLWDGIKRDRLVWMGDMHTEVLTIQSVFGANSIVPKSLDFLRDGTPPTVWMNGISSYSLWWIMVQADWYKYTGDMEYLAQQRGYLKALMENVVALVDENGSEQMPEMRFIDWPNHADPVAEHAGLQGILKLAIEAGADMLKALGEDEQAAASYAVAGRMNKHVPECGKSKQAAAFLSLSGIADAKKINDEVLTPGGAHGYSTFLGYYTMAAKALAGDWQGAIDDMRAYWGGMLDMGATTFWEDFDLNWMENACRIDEIVPEGKVDVHGDWGAYCYVMFRHSLCHGWSSGPVPYAARHILGITILEPGCKKIAIEPHLGDLAYARGSYPTPLGLVTVSHEKRPDGSIATEYTAPEGMEVVVRG